jgi:4a-hydroxytetrahydrobiopterin dehydratase
MTELEQLPCEACTPSSPTVTADEMARWQSQLPGWSVIEVEGVLQLKKMYSFPDFKSAIAFTNAIGEEAEKVGHHPALLTEWGKVTVTWWTHSIQGLHRNDLIMAARTDALNRSRG